MRLPILHLETWSFLGVDGEIRPGLFLGVHGRFLRVLLSGFLFFYIRWYSLNVVGVPVNIPAKK